MQWFKLAISLIVLVLSVKAIYMIVVKKRQSNESIWFLSGCSIFFITYWLGYFNYNKIIVFVGYCLCGICFVVAIIKLIIGVKKSWSDVNNRLDEWDSKRKLRKIKRDKIQHISCSKCDFMTHEKIIIEKCPKCGEEDLIYTTLFFQRIVNLILTTGWITWNLLKLLVPIGLLVWLIYFTIGTLRNYEKTKETIRNANPIWIIILWLLLPFLAYYCFKRAEEMRKKMKEKKEKSGR